MRALREQIEELDGNEVYGRVVGVRGLMVEVAGPLHTMSVGARVVIETKDQPIPCEVVGFSGGTKYLFPGIGGILDLLDSLLFNAPIMYLYLRHVLTRP